MKKEKEKKKNEKIEEKDVCMNNECECENCSCEECNCEEGCCTCEECECENCECNEYEEKIGELTEKLQRAQAEVINFKRRKEEETSQLLKYCNKDVLLDMVSIADNFERAIKMDDANLSDEVSKFLEGFKMIYANMIDTLRQNEVVEINCLNKEFDASTMEAIIVEHTDGAKPHEVVDVLQKGFMYKDIVLRPAMVKIND